MARRAFIVTNLSGQVLDERIGLLATVEERQVVRC
jgi:hypothetical protein